MTGSDRRHDPTRPWYSWSLRLLPEAPGRWVDLGCGRGELLDLADGRPPGLARPLGIGLDRSIADLRDASRGGRSCVAADLTRSLPFRDASLDGACLVEVIEHIANAETLVAELARVVRPGGWLVVTTPNVVHLTYRLRTLTGHPPKQEGYHLRFFTRETLRRVFESNGFSVVDRASFGKQALLTKLARLAGRAHDQKVRYRVPAAFEGLLAQHFVWRLTRGPQA